MVTVCYAADALATFIFPPATALAPVCNYLGFAKAGQKAANVIVH